MVWSGEDEEEGPVSEADSSLHPKAGSRAVLERGPLRDNTALGRRIGTSNSACYCSQAVSERPLALRTGLTTGVPTTRKLGTAFASSVPKPNSFLSKSGDDKSVRALKSIERSWRACRELLCRDYGNRIPGEAVPSGPSLFASTNVQATPC